jgi:hypothetical protein
MLVRILTAEVSARNVAEANGLMRQFVDELRAQPGLVDAKLAGRVTSGDDQGMILLEEWLTPAHLVRWTSGRLDQARLPEGAPRLLENLVITLYESLDQVPNDLDIAMVGDADDRQVVVDLGIRGDPVRNAERPQHEDPAD